MSIDDLKKNPFFIFGSGIVSGVTGLYSMLLALPCIINCELPPGPKPVDPMSQYEISEVYSLGLELGKGIVFAHFDHPRAEHKSAIVVSEAKAIGGVVANEDHLKQMLEPQKGGRAILKKEMEQYNEFLKGYFSQKNSEL